MDIAKLLRQSNRSAEEQTAVEMEVSRVAARHGISRLYAQDMVFQTYAPELLEGTDAA